MRVCGSIAVFVTTFTLLSCGDDTSEEPLVTVHRSSAERELSPNITDDQFSAFNRSNGQFSWDLYHELAGGSEGENIFLSPYSISTALAMTYAGAQGETKKEMSKALNFELDDTALHAGFNKLSMILDSKNLPETNWDAALSLNINNTLWPGLKILNGIAPEFLDVLAQNYGSGLHALDFSQYPEACRAEINDAVYGWTNELIDELILPGDIDVFTTFVITNTIYMKAPWESPFIEWQTATRDFNNYDGSTSDVDMMNQVGFDMRYVDHEQAEVLAIPYRGGDLEMVLITPKGDFDAFEQGLTQDKIDVLRQGLVLAERGVDLSLPRFSMEFWSTLVEPMKALGMKLAFADGAADFGLIGDGVVISQIRHKAFLDVKEEGTEAAAATAVIGSSGSAPFGEIRVVVDQPFIFIIHERETGAILFSGRVLKL